jgi:DnaJ-domain-containing protein 1
MSEEDLAKEVAAQNKRKLEEHLRRLQEKGPQAAKAEEQAEGAQGKRPGQARQQGPSPNKAREAWEAWKRYHGQRVHNLRDRQALPPQPSDDLKLLGLQPGATQTDIRKAYYKLAKTHHPDAGGKPEKFQALLEAYERLSKVAPA